MKITRGWHRGRHLDEAFFLLAAENVLDGDEVVVAEGVEIADLVVGGEVGGIAMGDAILGLGMGRNLKGVAKLLELFGSI